LISSAWSRPQVGGRELQELLTAPEHVRADARDVEILGDVEKLPEERLVAFGQGRREGVVEPPQLADLAEDDHVSALPMLTSAPGMRASPSSRKTPRSDG